ncbi:dorsal-ventral patterning protein Sog-like isoform X3 [Panulirus ornatus]|uniref:dorsal-ventral patterning protein Sog-like isoform X3 n=1 Tax=Panulirus ornatus TaxID=150431 RepID=UPI003A85C744
MVVRSVWRRLPRCPTRSAVAARFCLFVRMLNVCTYCHLVPRALEILLLAGHPALDSTSPTLAGGVTSITASRRDEPLEQPEELTGRDFAVLLNGRTSQTPMTTSRVATGRLFLRKKTLHFSFLLEDGAPTPASIHFMSDTGDILEELEPQPTPYEATNSRICGTWTRVPKEYRALLRDEKMWVALYPPEDSHEDMISGQVARYVGVDTEVFSALLTPMATANQTLSGGGTAIISVDRKTDSLHVSLVFNGIFAPGEAHNATLVVELLPERALDPVTDMVVIPKVFSDLNRAEVMTTLGERSLIRLTRGQVAMKLWSQTAPELALEGMITPRATCNVFSAVLSKPMPDPEDGETSERTEVAMSTPPHGAGWALLTLSNDGTFQYQMFVKGIEVSTLTLETKHRRRHRIVDNLILFYQNNWANGTYDRPTYRDLDALLRGKLEVVVSGGENDEKLRGMLTPVAVTEALRSPQPVLLSSPEVPMAATVWVAVDSACVTHYDVMVAGQPPAGVVEPHWNLILREEDGSWDPRFEMTKMDLETKVEGWELSAHSTMLTQLALTRLGAGVSYLDLVLLPFDNSSHQQPALSGLIQGVYVPPSCLVDAQHKVTVEDDDQCSYGGCLDQPSPGIPPSHRCIDEDKKVFEDGTSWQSPINPCSMCMCTRGEIKCQDVVCHKLDCEGAYTPPGECCQMCPVGNDVTEESNMCELNNQKHLLGSKWHPFLPPRGFDKCVSCICMLHPSGRPEVNCSRFRCPPLLCGPDDMEQEPDDCCAKCRTPRPEVPLPIAQPGMVNEGERLTEEEQRNNILSNGGCLLNQMIYVNGAEWHPRVTSIGFYECVTCKCKDSNITCANPRCPYLHCQAMIQVEQECCPRCANENSTINLGNKVRWLKPYKKTIHKNKGNNQMRNSG